MASDRMLERLLRPEIRELIEGRQWVELQQALEPWAAPEIADLIMELPKEDRVLAYRALPRTSAAEVFAHLEFEEQNTLLRDLSDRETQDLLADLPPDDRTHVLSELPGQATQRMLNLLSPEDLDEARWLLGYPPESVGRLMTPDYVAVHPEWSVSDALAHIRKMGSDSETVNRIFVVDDGWRLLDDIELRRFILSPPEALVADLMDHAVATIAAMADREEAVGVIRRYDQVALPVVDSEGILVGIITVDDVLDVAEQEATEDFHKIGSVGPIQGSLRDAPLHVLYRRRIGWLLTLVFVNVLSGAAIANYQALIERVVALVFFLPLLIASAGNAGSQAATLMIRAMATGDVRAKDWLSLLSREAAVAGVLGGTMAAAVAAIGFFRGGAGVAVVVASTMILVVLIGSLIGMSLPFLLNRFRLDPATASAPLVTSIADITGVVVYLSIANWYLAV